MIHIETKGIKILCFMFLSLEVWIVEFNGPASFEVCAGLQPEWGATSSGFIAMLLQICTKAFAWLIHLEL